MTKKSINIHKLSGGNKVKYSFPDSGNDIDKENAKKYLAINKIYTIIAFTVDKWRTEIYLYETPYIAFNSVMFSDVVKKSKKQKV
jgi:hypothetical protein